jgi:hypothetical protein
MVLLACEVLDRTALALTGQWLRSPPHHFHRRQMLTARSGLGGVTLWLNGRRFRDLYLWGFHFG